MNPHDSSLHCATLPASRECRRGRRRQGGRGRGGGGGGGGARGGWFLHDDRGGEQEGAYEEEGVFEGGDPSYYRDSSSLTVRISATRRGAREVSDSSGVFCCFACFFSSAFAV